MASIPNPYPPGGLTANYPDQIPAQEYGLVQGTSFWTKILAAIANRDNARVDIPVIGESITEGRDATEFTNRWIARANNAIRSQYQASVNTSPASGGLGFVPIQQTGPTSTYTWPITLASGTEGGVDYGPVRACSQTEGAATWTWVAPTGTTSVKIMYFDVPAAGSFTYKVNSGSTTTVTGTETSTDLLTSSISISSGDTLTMEWVSGVVCLDGLLHFAGDEDAGITFHGCGHQGWGVANWNTNGSVGGTPNWFQAFNAFSPAAFAIELGAEDAITTAEGGNGWTAAQLQDGLASFIANLRLNASTLAELPVLLIAEYEINQPFVQSWPAYVAAIREVADADPIGAHLMDLNYRLPTIPSNWAGGILYADTNHPTDLGHALIGEINASALRIG